MVTTILLFNATFLKTFFCFFLLSSCAFVHVYVL